MFFSSIFIILKLSTSLSFILSFSNLLNKIQLHSSLMVFCFVFFLIILISYSISTFRIHYIQNFWDIKIILTHIHIYIQNIPKTVVSNLVIVLIENDLSKLISEVYLESSFDCNVFIYQIITYYLILEGNFFFVFLCFMFILLLLN